MRFGMLETKFSKISPSIEAQAIFRLFSNACIVVTVPISSRCWDKIDHRFSLLGLNPESSLATQLSSRRMGRSLSTLAVWAVAPSCIKIIFDMFEVIAICRVIQFFSSLTLHPYKLYPGC